MCIEDVRLGRKTGTAISTVTVGVTSVPLVKANADRTSITLFALTAERYTISDGPVSAVDQGPTINPGTGPVVLTIQTHGLLVTKELQALASAAGQAVSVIETFLRER